MNEGDLSAFLARPLTAVIGTLARDGAPHAVPVWYRFDGHAFTIWTDEQRAWVRQLRRDPRCALTVAEHEPPFGAVLVRGRAEIATGADTAPEIRRIAERYVEADEVDAYIDSFRMLHTIVTVIPQVMRSWGRGY